MKIKLDCDAVMKRADKMGVYTMRMVCKNAGVNVGRVYNDKWRGSGVSLTTAYLIATYLNCLIEDIIEVDWSV